MRYSDNARLRRGEQGVDSGNSIRLISSFFLPKFLPVTIDSVHSHNYCADTDHTVPAVITYEANPSLWKEIEPPDPPPNTNTPQPSPVSVTIKEDGADGMLILTETLPLPTEAAQTYSWNGKNASDEFVAPGVYQVKIAVVRSDEERYCPLLNPSTSLRLESADRLVFLARAYEDCEVRTGDLSQHPKDENRETAPARVKNERRILILGWNHKVAAFLKELARYIHERFDIAILSLVPAAERETELNR